MLCYLSEAIASLKVITVRRALRIVLTRAEKVNGSLRDDLARKVRGNSAIQWR